MHGLAQFKSVSGSAIPAHGQLLPRCRPLDLKCVEVHIKNDSNQVIVIDGEQSTATVAGQSVRAANVAQIIAASDCELSAGKKIAVATVALTTFGFFAPLSYELLTPRPDLGVPFRADGPRWKAETLHLGRRLIMPGDDTTGWLCFDAAGADQPQEVQIPLSSDQGGKTGLLILPVAAVKP